MRFISLLVLSCLLVSGGRSHAAEEPLVEKVRKALDGGIAFLKKEQKDQGNGIWSWEKNSALVLAQPGGFTTLAMLALLTSGVPSDDPVIRRALPYLRSLEPKQVYVVGLQTMVLTEVAAQEKDPIQRNKDLFQIQKNVDWLIDSAVTKDRKLRTGGRLEGWSYTASKGTSPDNSNTQYALLGLLAGRQAGASIDPQVWQSIHNYYVGNQFKPRLDSKQREIAGWGYKLPGMERETHTMTAAGLSGLFISALEINTNVQQLDERTGIAAKCGFYPNDDAVARGMRWLAQEFRFENSPHTFYNVYGIERVGRLSGQRFIGSHDWYRRGCEILTGAVPENTGMAQKPDGAFKINGASLDADPVLSTSFGLLFLAKGRTPILINKFAWDEVGGRPGSGINWNRKHYDAQHLAEYSSRELFKKMPLAWQVFDARQVDLSTEARFDEELVTLLQSPILYMNGHGAPNLTPSQKRLLRRYVDEGGFILAEACCGDEEFARGFRKLMEDKEVFGQESPLLPLDPGHPIWSSHTLIPADVFQGERIPEEKKIQAIERGCKTVVVFSPQPLAGFWEEARFSPKRQAKMGEGVDVTDRGTLAYRLAGNIIAYATGFEPPRPRLEMAKIVDQKQDDSKLARYIIELAQIRHDGGDWQPAKNALRSLAVNLRDKYLIDVSLAKQDIPMSQQRLWQYKFVYMHGKGAFTTDEKELENMRAHLEVGGTLLADACCGAEQFDTAFRSFARKLYPDKKLELIPEDDFLYSEKLNGEAISTVRCRLETADKKAEANFKEVKPMLEGIKIDGRWAIIYSRYDIGCALEKNKSSACKGYDPASAMKLATAAVLYSLKK
jgi:hypothetical protein